MTKIEQGWSPQCDGRQAEPGEWGVLKVGCMNSGVYVESENKALPPELEPVRSYEIKVGDVLMSRSNTVELVGAVGRVHQTQGRILLCDKLYRLDLDDEVLHSGFAVYLLRSHAARLQLERDASGASPSMKNISNERVANMVLAFPSIPEQRAIAAFLDRKTAQIDAVVAKKQRLIERLQEKRQALISHAVTKGLDAHAPMKDSGIEWLKEVPAHWMVRRFRHCGTIPNGQVDPRLPAYRDMVLIAPNHIESETGRLLLTETAFEQGAGSGKYVAQKGDVIYSKIRPELQKACIAPERCLCSADMYPITPKPDMVAEYILYNLLCDWFTKYAVLWSDRVAMPKVNRETFGNCFMVVPPLDEQKQIVRHITAQTEHIDKMTDRIRTQISKLQEYRQTLISAAVTGKINVTKEAAC